MERDDLPAQPRIEAPRRSSSEAGRYRTKSWSTGSSRTSRAIDLAWCGLAGFASRSSPPRSAPPSPSPPSEAPPTPPRASSTPRSRSSTSSSRSSRRRRRSRLLADVLNALQPGKTSAADQYLPPGITPVQALTSFQQYVIKANQDLQAALNCGARRPVLRAACTRRVNGAEDAGEPEPDRSGRRDREGRSPPGDPAGPGRDTAGDPAPAAAEARDRPGGAALQLLERHLQGRAQAHLRQRPTRCGRRPSA